MPRQGARVRDRFRLAALLSTCVLAVLALTPGKGHAAKTLDCTIAAQVDFAGRRTLLCGAQELSLAGLQSGDLRREDGSLARMDPADIEALKLAVDLNGASPGELATLPGIGPKLADRIVEARPFEGTEDVLKVRGVGPKKLAAMRTRAFVSPRSP